MEAKKTKIGKKKKERTSISVGIDSAGYTLYSQVVPVQRYPELYYFLQGSPNPIIFQDNSLMGVHGTEKRKGKLQVQVICRAFSTWD